MPLFEKRGCTSYTHARKNARSEVVKDVNPDRVDWYREDEEESMLENVCQFDEEGVRGVFATPTALKEGKVFSVNVSVASLQGDLINSDVYVSPPKELVSTRPNRQEAIPWKLNRQLYGLTDASRKWCCRMDKEFTRLGCQRSKHDHAVYNLWKGGELQGQIPLHVDDPLHGGSDLFHREVISSFMGIFA